MSEFAALASAFREIRAFGAPLWIPPAAALALWLAWRAWRARPTALAWPALAEAREAGARSRDFVRTLSIGLRASAALCLALVLAEPLGFGQGLRLRHDGLDLVLVLDASGSMRALDAEIEGQARTRLELAREVVARFAKERAAEGDRVALVVFGERAFTQCPLSSDGALLAAALARVEAGVAGEATAVGDALALAVKRVAPTATAGAEAPLAGRLVVLLTDGRSNAGAVPTDVAAALAAQRRVRVHTVGIGGEGELAMATSGGTRSLRTQRHDLDSDTLRRIAETTGGRFFHARSSAALAEIYRAIDELERVPRELPSRPLDAPLPEPLLALAAGLLSLELLAARVLWRRLP